MRSSPTGRTSVQWQRWVLAATVALLVLAPWWRHHRYLRDFFDYGLVMTGAARIEAGERPYVDFVTPIQTGTFLFNAWPQRLGGGTFQAMTWGGAVQTLLGAALLLGLFARRWPFAAAAALAAALTAMTLAQHTIIWHNAAGALGIAVAAASAATAPVWRRATWPWHLLTAAALVLGGLMKLNAHLVALCAVLAWALRAGGTGQAGWPRALATVAAALCLALVVPVGLELAWTQASPAAWWYNVVALPFGSRSGDLAAALDWKFYFAVRHDYYGTLPVPQLGAVGLLATGAVATAALRARGRREAGWVIAAALFAAAAGVGLLATNYDIAYVALGAWFALLAALWLGFGLRPAGAAFYGCLIGPALLVGALAWHSAWLGQRSQFGYSRAPRTEYVAAETIAPDFAYLRGTRLPPELAGSLRAAAAWRAALPPAERAAVFYGPGLEWLERPWPAVKIPGMSLWMHGGTSYGPAEEAKLMAALAPTGPFAHVLVPEAWDHWEYVVTAELAGKYVQRRMGPVWFRYDKLPPGRVSWRPFAFLNAFGGNVNSTQLISEMRLQTLADGRGFLAVDHGAGTMTLAAPSYRAQAEAVLRRLPGQPWPDGAAVRFAVESQAPDAVYPRWSAALQPPAGQDELVVPFPIDCGGLPLRFQVTVPPELAGRVQAGWRALKLLHSADGPEQPLMMRPEAPDAVLADEAMRRALLPAGWSPPAVHVRGGRVGKDGLEVAPGGEVWIRLAGTYAELNGTAVVPAGPALKAEPVVRVFYAKGAKLDVLAQDVVRDPARRFDFRAWSAEPDGWLVILVDPAADAPAVSLRLTTVRAAP